MSAPESKSFHKIRSLEGVLRSAIKGEAPRDTSLPLGQVLLPALNELVDNTQASGEDPRPAMQHFSLDLDRWQRFLAYLQDTTNRWYIFQQREWQFSKPWWQEQFSSLKAEFDQDPPAGARQWFQIFSEALVEWDLEGLQVLVDQPYPFPDYLAFVPLMFEDGVKGLSEGNWSEAEDMLTFLIRPEGLVEGQPPLAAELQSAVLVLMGRIALEKEDEEGALSQFEKARQLAPQDGRPLAAIGSYHRAKEAYDQADSMLREAVRLSPEQPEGYCGMAYLMDAQKLWDEANAWYRQAVDCALRFPDPYRALTRLLAPVTGNLYFHLSQALQDISEKWALPAIEQALELGIAGSQAYPEVEAYALQGKLLRKMRRKPEAAIAYYEAGRRSGWNIDYQQAVDLLRRSLKLDETMQAAYWYLSDDLRLLALSLDKQAEIDKLINESLKVWEQGAALGEITSEHSWALFTRALLNEILPARRSFPPQELELFAWEAVFFVERNLLISNDKAFQWTYLARFYRSLNLQANNQYALDRAWKLDPTDNQAREEKIIRLTNRGEFDEAEKLLEPMLQEENYPDKGWALSVKGFIFSRQGKYEPALKLSQENIQELWVRSYRTLCFLQLDDLPTAVQEFETVWEGHTTEIADNLLDYANAGLYLSLLDPEHADDLALAIQYARRYLKNSTDPFGAYYTLGLCLLANDELDEGGRMLEESIQYANNRRELLDCIDNDFPILQQLMITLPHGKQIKKTLKNISTLMTQQLEVVDQRMKSPEEELNRNLVRLLENEHPGIAEELVARSRLGARAGLARLHLDAGRWIEAADAYNELLATADEIPESRLGLGKTLAGMLQAAQAALNRGEYESALPILEKASQVASELDQQEIQPQITCQLAFAHLSLASTQPKPHLAAAAESLVAAAEGYRQDGRQDAWLAVSESLRSLLTSASHYWSLDEALGELLETLPAVDGMTSGELRQDISSLRQALDDYLAEKYGLGSSYGGNLAANRIAIELGRDLIPEGSSQDWILFSQMIPWIRKEFLDKYGLELPGIHLRLAANDLAADEFRILIDGQQAARNHGLPAQDSTLLIFTGLIYALIYNLERFFDAQTAARLLQEWQKINPGLYLLLSKALPDQPARLAFGRALREVAREGVAINYPLEFQAVIPQIDLRTASQEETVRRLRLALQSHLPGNSPEAQRIELPSELEEQILNYLQLRDGKPLLIMPAAEQEQLVSAIRQLVSAGAPQSDSTSDPGADSSATTVYTLVCQDASLRPLLRRLVEHSLPYLAVLSAEEVLHEFPPEDEPAPPAEEAAVATPEATREDTRAEEESEGGERHE